MAKTITNKKTVDEILKRGVESIYPNRETLKKKLLTGEKIKLYCGFDPSASSLHIGNAIQINKLAQFQALGHEVIFLIGDFTGMIGDPTDKTAARKTLTRKEVLDNAKNYEKQASAYLNFKGDNPAKIVYNSKWHDKMTFKDLIEVSSNFTVQQMIQRDMFQVRLKEEKPIHVHEFLYPVAQGYDTVAMDVDLEIGGNDQMFNMMAGRDLMKSMKNKEKFVLTTKLLVDPTGKKMGKTEGNIISLDAEPNDMYGQVMAWPDGVIATGFELCTNIPLKEVDDIHKQLKKDKVNPRDLKMKLAKEITRINYGEKEAEEAEGHFVKTIQKKEVPDDIEIKKVRDGRINIIQLLTLTNLALGTGDARRLIQGGGVKVDGKKITFIGEVIDIKKEGVVVQKGKRFFVKVIKE